MLNRDIHDECWIPESPKGESIQEGPVRPFKRTAKASSAASIRKIATEQIAIDADGGTMVMTRWEAFVRQIHTLALCKDASAARLLHQIRRQFPGKAAPGDRHILVVSDDDMEL